MTSIGYSNYLKHYYRFTLINKNKKILEETYKEMEERKKELKELPGYELIFNWLKQYIDYFFMVESGIKIFEKALEHFKE